MEDLNPDEFVQILVSPIFYNKLYIGALTILIIG